MNTKIFSLSGVALSLLVAGVTAQTPNQAARDRQIQYRETRIAEITDDIIRSDERIESGIDAILAELKSVTDSNESQTNVARTKKSVIEALIRSIEYYDVKRRDLKAETMKRDPKLSRDILFSDKAKFDARIEKRIGQIVELANSLEGDEEYQRWIVEYRGGDSNRSRRWRDDDNSYVRNPDYIRNRKERDLDNSMKKTLVTELEESIQRLDSANRTIEEKLKLKITDQYREMLTNEKTLNADMINERQNRIAELQESPKPQTQQISRDEAHDIQQMIDDLADDLRKEFNTLFANYAELNVERQALKKLTDAEPATK